MISFSLTVWCNGPPNLACHGHFDGTVGLDYIVNLVMYRFLKAVPFTSVLKFKVMILITKIICNNTMENKTMNLVDLKLSINNPQ